MFTASEKGYDTPEAALQLFLIVRVKDFERGVKNVVWLFKFDKNEFKCYIMRHKLKNTNMAKDIIYESLKLQADVLSYQHTSNAVGAQSYKPTVMRRLLSLPTSPEQQKADRAYHALSEVCSRKNIEQGTYDEHDIPIPAQKKGTEYEAIEAVNGCDLNQLTTANLSLLHAILASNRVDILQLFIALGANPNTSNVADGHNWTPLHAATRYCCTDLSYGTKMIAALVKLGANPNALDRYDDSPMEIAKYPYYADINAATITKALTSPEDESIPEPCPAENRIGVDFAANDTSSAAVDVAPPALRQLPLGANRWTALHHAAKDGDVAKLPNLQGVDINQKTPQTGATALHIAARFNNSKMVEELVRLNADINQTDDEGHTALIAASEAGALDAIRTLVRSRADVDQTEKKYGNATALYFAASKGHINAVIELLISNATPYLSVGDAIPKGREDIRLILEPYFAKREAEILSSNDPSLAGAKSRLLEQKKHLADQGVAGHDSSASTELDILQPPTIEQAEMQLLAEDSLAFIP